MGPKNSALSEHDCGRILTHRETKSLVAHSSRRSRAKDFETLAPSPAPACRQRGAFDRPRIDGVRFPSSEDTGDGTIAASADEEPDPGESAADEEPEPADGARREVTGEVDRDPWHASVGMG